MSFLNAGTVGVVYRVIVKNVIRITRIDGVRITLIISIDGVKITSIIPSDGIRITLIILSNIVNGGVRITLIILSEWVKVVIVVGGNKMDKKLLLSPPVKYNLEVLANKFKLSPGDPFKGEYTYRLTILSSMYKFFYAPVSVLDMYFSLDTGETIPVVSNFFIPTDIIKELIVVRPENWTSGSVFFQYFLTNSESKDFQVFDLYESKDFDISPSGHKTVRVPFPTYNFKFLFTVQSANPNYKLQILQYYYKVIKSYQLESKDDITEKEINNLYLMNQIGGSGAVTEPNYPFPSWHTYIDIKNNAGTVDMTGCFMKVVSWL